jgi:hypothetical protein
MTYTALTAPFPDKIECPVIGMSVHQPLASP